MKAVILAGGLGTRISEETSTKPKPLVEIAGYPVLWHIMKIFSHYGVNDFIICCGYKGYLIKEYFANYSRHISDITVDLRENKIELNNNMSEPWKITMIDTGLNTMTGGRLKRVKEYIEDEESFFFTYGDGVGNIDINKLLDFHKQHGRKATVTAANPPGRFGALSIKNKQVLSFTEKPIGDGGVVNAGFFVLNPSVIDYIKDDETIWEKEPLENLSRDSELMAFSHNEFWQPMDTLRDKKFLQKLWDEGEAPWKLWK